MLVSLSPKIAGILINTRNGRYHFMQGRVYDVPTGDVEKYVKNGQLIPTFYTELRNDQVVQVEFNRADFNFRPIGEVTSK